MAFLFKIGEMMPFDPPTAAERQKTLRDLTKALSESESESLSLAQIKPLLMKAMALGMKSEPIQGMPLLSFAAQNSTPEVVAWICERLRPADLETTDALGRTALFFAFKYGRLDNATALLNAGASLALTPANEELIQYAAESSVEALSLLASRGIDFNFADEDEGLTPLMRAVRSRERCRFETIAFLIDQGVDLNATSLRGLSARDQLMTRMHFPRGPEILEMFDAALLAKGLDQTLKKGSAKAIRTL